MKVTAYLECPYCYRSKGEEHDLMCPIQIASEKLLPLSTDPEPTYDPEKETGPLGWYWY